ncbi:MAG: hypothetical protein JWL77_2707 [Chthonomonadaceae bacterium]|nr:hypothetical protein [Chthonomonadaceae bacterium]
MRTWITTLFLGVLAVWMALAPLPAAAKRELETDIDGQSFLFSMLLFS